VRSHRIRTGKAPTTPVGRLAAPLLAVLALGLLTGASCKKDSRAAKTDPREVIAAADAANQPLDRSPIPGVDTARLPPARQDVFFRLVGSLPSPCGKAHSLRTSVTSDAECKRAPYAVRFLFELISDELGETQARELYNDRYVTAGAPRTFDLGTSPSVGPADAPVTLVEFFDYGCPVCVQTKPIVDQVIRENRGKLRVVYKMYPLKSKHPDSYGCAQAALAARAQGKFHEMHDIIFDKFGAQTKDDLRGYAESLGLDMARYDADFAAAEARINADLAEGQLAGVDGTPTFFMNGRKYPAIGDAKYFAMAIEEEAAVR